MKGLVIVKFQVPDVYADKREREDVQLLANLRTELMQLNQDVDIDLETRECDEYHPWIHYLYAESINHSEHWASGCVEIMIERQEIRTAYPGTRYGSFLGFNIEFIDGEADDSEYRRDPKAMRAKWLADYVVDFKKTYPSLIKKYKFFSRLTILE